MVPLLEMGPALLIPSPAVPDIVMVPELVMVPSELKIPSPPILDIVIVPVAVLLMVPVLKLVMLLPKPVGDIVRVPEFSMVPALLMVPMLTKDPVEVMVILPVALFVRV